jgi:hypothetical protein
MPTQNTEFRCLIISPSDVVTARDAAEGVMHRWSSQIGGALRARVVPVRWEWDTHPALGDRPQAIINEQIVDTADLAIAIFWSRLGTPTGVHESGSVEEIERLRRVGKPVMLYFSTEDVPQNALRDDQFRRLQEVKSHYQQEGLVASFTSTEALRESLLLHLTAHINALLLKQREGETLPSVGRLTAPIPDIRVKAALQQVFELGGKSGRDVLTITIENHSPIDFFLSSVAFPLDDGTGLWPKHDTITGEPNRARRIEPGNSFQFHMDPANLVKQAGKRHIVASAIDQIGREFRSEHGAVQEQLAHYVSDRKKK